MSLYKNFSHKYNHFIQYGNSIHRFISFWIQFMNIVWKEMNNFLLMDETVWEVYEYFHSTTFHNFTLQFFFLFKLKDLCIRIQQFKIWTPHLSKRNFFPIILNPFNDQKMFSSYSALLDYFIRKILRKSFMLNLRSRCCT